MTLENECSKSDREMLTEVSDVFYKFIHENCQAFTDRLQCALEIREISVKDLRHDSGLTIVCQCGTLGALENLNQMYRSKRLLAIYQNVLVTGSVLGILDIKGITLDVDISSDAVDNCREVFLARKFRECNIVHPTDLLPPPSADDISVGNIPNQQGACIKKVKFSKYPGEYRLD